LKIVGIVVAIVAMVAYFGNGSSTTASKNVVAIPKAVTPQPQVKPSTPDRALKREEVIELQTLLRKQGFNPGTPDGVIGSRTRAAVQAFAKAHQVDILHTEPSLRLLEVARGP
jgi:peptidoglycan hydrolase-like protein with peptidoglycan-binding domain